MVTITMNLLQKVESGVVMLTGMNQLTTGNYALLKLFLLLGVAVLCAVQNAVESFHRTDLRRCHNYFLHMQRLHLIAA